MNKYTEKLVAKFDELFAEYVDDFCPEELVSSVKESFSQDWEDMCHDGCIFKVGISDAIPNISEVCCDATLPNIVCCIKSIIRSTVYTELGIIDEIIEESKKDY